MTQVPPDRTSYDRRPVLKVASGGLLRTKESQWFLSSDCNPSSIALNCASRQMVASGAIGIGGRRFFLIFTDWGFTRDSLHV